MAEQLNGYEFSEIVRKEAGSPGIWYVLGSRTQSCMVDVLGSPGVYVNFEGASATTGSANLFIPDNQFRSFDLRIGSVNIMSLTGSPVVQFVGLYD